MGFGGLLDRLFGRDFSDYTDLRTQEGFYRTLDDFEPATQTIENAVMMVAQTASRCAVTVEGNLGDVWRDIVRPGRFLAILMRDLMVFGNAVYEIEDPPALKRVSDYELYGKRMLRYRITHAYPDGQTVRNLPAEAVCHVLINPHRDSPWEGNSPFDKCRLHWAVEQGYEDQARLTSKRYIASPTPETDPQSSDTDYVSSNQKLAEQANEPGTSFVFSQTSRNQDMKIQHVDLTFSPTAPGVEMRRDLILEVWEAISYPPILRAEAPPGQAEKDSRAAWIDGWLQSTMDNVAEQLSASLECEIAIDTTPCRVPQVHDQSKIVNELVLAGVPLDEAKNIAGF